MSKKLVAYFSASGVTAKVAQTLSETIVLMSLKLLRRFRTRRQISTEWTRTPAAPLR